ncbi:hypothetical protein [Azospirillum canadense]|uniref:hypothetical protein n=1 Tax=Azospirillum canadense TaxID=403962 RepID=UPI002226B79D|nr:hypothetical protein [Azospirillum canadense]MCW2239073.1 hypothetical protein [Azospirillum canadense]
MQIAFTVQTDDRFVFGARHWLAEKGVSHESVPIDVPGCGHVPGTRHWKLSFVRHEDAAAFRKLFAGIVVA